MKLQVIQLEPYDDVISVRDRLSFVESERVLLVWPRDGQLLKRKLDLVLIQREAARRGARVALVTDDLDVIDHAGELNISTFHRTDDAARARWKRPLDKVFVDRSDRPHDGPDAYELRTTESRLRPRTIRQRRVNAISRAVAGVVLIALIAGLILLFLPGASITIYPAQKQINTTIKLVADPSITQIDIEGGRVPAVLQQLTITTRASIPVTGSVDVPSTLASGTVLFTNQGDNPVFIPAGTVVGTFGLNPVKFRTTADVTIDGGKGNNVSATIEALQEFGGPQGNIEANLITVIDGDLANTLAVRNDAPTRGGTIRQQGVVTKSDQDNLLLLAREKLRQTALTEFSTKLNGTQFIAPDSIKIIGDETLSYNAFVNDQADTLTLDISAEAQAVVIDEQLAKQAALASLSSKIPAGQQISPQSVTFTRGAIQNTDPNEKVAFFMSAVGNIAVMIDAEQVKRQIAGSTVADALDKLDQNYLLDPRRAPEITVWPELFRRLPLLPLRISVTVKE